MACLVPEQERIVQTTVPGESEGTRLDFYLASRFTYRSRTAWQKAIRDGEIRLNGRKTHASRQLHTGEMITLQMSGAELDEPPVRTDFSILLDTPAFLAVNKPPDLPSHPSGRYFNHTLQRLLLPDFGTVHPVNRLDRETSGTMLFAKSGQAAKKLAALFETGSIRKTYLALVFGDFPEEWNATGFLSADPNSKIGKKRRFTTDLPEDAEDAVPCSTDFQKISYRDEMSLIRCLPHTGRLHQIRATLFSGGFPMVGDKLYGPDETVFLRFIKDTMTTEDRTILRMDHQALHAASLAFRSPFTGDDLCIQAPLPDDFLLKV